MDQESELSHYSVDQNGSTVILMLYMCCGSQYQSTYAECQLA